MAQDQNEFKENKRQSEAMHEALVERRRKSEACPTKHANSYLKFSPYNPVDGVLGRADLERVLDEDRRHGVNQQRQKNCWGLVYSYCPDCEETLPIICGHGGTMWLCEKCYLDMMRYEEKKQQEAFLDEAQVGGH